MENITQRQTIRLTESLAAMRNYEEADVILVCANKEFPCHKLVLKASCPYFKAMFQSNMLEATADKIVIQQVEPDSMDAVLDYLYLGKVPEIKSAIFLTNLTEAANMLQLTDLFGYCCDNLSLWLSENNVYKILNIAVLYDLQNVLKSVINYVNSNIDQILVDPQFLSLPYEDLRGLLKSAKDKVPISEELLLGIVNWIFQDIKSRETLVGELLQLINIKYLRREFMKFMIDSQEVRNTSMELTNSIKDVALDVFYKLSGCCCSGRCEITNDPSAENRLGIKVVFFTEYRVMTAFDANRKCFIKRKVPYNCVQQLDLFTMTWLPAAKLPFTGYERAAMCQHRDLIYMVGGRLESMYVMYDVASNTAKFVTCKCFNGEENGQLLPLKDHIYFVDQKCNVTQITPGKDCCVRCISAELNWSSPKAFATANWIYISYYESLNLDNLMKQKRFSCNNGEIKCENLMPIEQIPEGTSVYFTVSNRSNILYGFYVKNNHLIRVHNRNAVVNNWEEEEFSLCPSKLFEISSVYKPLFQKETVVVFVSAEDDNQRGIPNYLLEPETCKWIKLPPVKRKSEIPDDEFHQKVYFVQDLN